MSWRGKGSGEERGPRKTAVLFLQRCLSPGPRIVIASPGRKVWNYEQVPGDLLTTIVIVARMQKSGQKRMQNRELDF